MELDHNNIPTNENYYGNVNHLALDLVMMKEKNWRNTCYVHYNKYRSNIKVRRPFNVFGPYVKKDTRVIPSIVKSLRNNKIYNF